MIKAFKRQLTKYFVFYPKTKKLKEFKEELLDVLMEKYQALIASGIDSDIAFKQCIDSLDDYKETAEQLAQEKSEDLTTTQRKLILLSSIVYVTFVTLVYFIISLACGWKWSWLTWIGGVVIALTIIGFFLLRKAQKNSRFVVVRITLPLIITLLATAVYLIVSFAVKTHWDMTWITYFIAALIWYTTDVWYRAKHKAGGFKIFDWLILTFIITLFAYFVMSFILNVWNISWICFIAWPFIAMLGVLVAKINDYAKLNKKQ